MGYYTKTLPTSKGAVQTQHKAKYSFSTQIVSLPKPSALSLRMPNFLIAYIVFRLKFLSYSLDKS